MALQLPSGWRVEPASASVTFGREDEETTVRFTVTPPAAAAPGEFAAKAVVTSDGGANSDLGYQVVEYPHIHRRHVVQAAAVRMKVFDIAIAPALKVGYIMGVGDQVPDAIAQLGADVRMIDADTLASGICRSSTSLSSACARTIGGRICARTISGCLPMPKTAAP